jgi:hypothetical protein
MPTLQELKSIADYSSSNPAIDTDYFPNSVSLAVWSGAPFAVVISKRTWFFNFSSGLFTTLARDGSIAVRLVRSGQ